MPLRKGLTGANNSTKPVSDAMQDALTSSDPYLRNIVGGGDSFYDSDAVSGIFHLLYKTNDVGLECYQMQHCENKYLKYHRLKNI